MLEDLELDKRALDQRCKRTERRIREILALRAAIPGDLMDVIGADVELPAVLRAQLPPADLLAGLPAPPDGPADELASP